MRSLAAVISALVLLSALAVAQTNTPAQPAKTQAQATQPAETPGTQPALPETREKLGAGTSPTDRISRETLHELLMLPYYTVFDNLEYRVEGHTVYLSGQVVNPTLKSDAGNVVKHIEGVEKVVNNIKVLPPSPMDDRIRRAEFFTIYRNDSLNKYAWGAIPGIHIIVDNGHVTLIGEVDNEADKNIANIQANSVPGVFSVTNKLWVKPREKKG
jgi:hyperosmotically inducible protein